MEPTVFSATEFINSWDPWGYMTSRGLCEPNVALPDQELQRLRASLPDMDEVHVSFALVIAERHCPSMFATDAAVLLSHRSQSVRTNAYRVLRTLDTAVITDPLRHAVAMGLSMCPEKELFADAVCRS